MKNFIISLYLLLFSLAAVQAQPVKIQREPIPDIPPEMTFKEYQQLVRELDWKRIGLSALVPGYIHLYAEKRKLAYTIAGIRGCGMVLSSGALWRQWYEAKTFQFVRGGHWEANFTAFMVGMMLNAVGFAFDWAHGDWIIEKERTLVQYKYGLRKELENSGSPHSNRGINFYWTVSRHF